MKYFSLLILLLSSFALAQSDQSHDVNVNVPSVLRIRLTSGESNLAVANPTPVEFDFVTEQERFDTGVAFAPTNTANWNDVIVMTNYAGAWQVDVSVSDNSFSWSKVAVNAQGGLAMPFDLTDGSVVAFGLTKTGGWQSLGFGPSDFSIAFDGSEEAGTYTTEVTYEIYGL